MNLRARRAEFFGSISSRTGMTLVETLLALALALLVLTWMGSALWALRRTAEGGVSRDRDRNIPRRALLDMAWELESACEAGAGSPAMASGDKPDPSGGVDVLVWHAALRPGGEVSPEIYDVYRVTYRLEPRSVPPGSFRLLRVVSPLQEDSAAGVIRTNELAGVLGGLGIRFYPAGGGKPTRRWPAAGGGGLPERIGLEAWPPGHTAAVWRTEAAIPAARGITSRTDRVRSAPAL